MTDAIQAARIGAGAAIVGGLIGGFLSGAYQHLRDHLTRSQLDLDFDVKNDKVEASWLGQSAFDGLILRVRLRNTGRKAASGCKVFVTGSTESHQSGVVETNFRDSRQAPWAGWSFETRSVPNGINFYLDFVRISKETPGWIFPFERQMARDRDLSDFRGTYHFRLTAVADDAKPFSITVAVTYDGDWHSVRAWKL